MIGLTEFLLCFSLLAAFFGYAVWKSPAVRVFGWCLMAGALTQAFLSDHTLVIAACVVATLVVATAIEFRAPRRAKPPAG